MVSTLSNPRNLVWRQDLVRKISLLCTCWCTPLWRSQFMQTPFLTLFFRIRVVGPRSMWKLGEPESFISSASPRRWRFLLWMPQFSELSYSSKNSHLLHSGVTQTFYTLVSVIIGIHYRVHVLLQVYISLTKASAQAWQNKNCMGHSWRAWYLGKTIPMRCRHINWRQTALRDLNTNSKPCTALSQACFHTQTNDHVTNTKAHHCRYCL